MIYYPDLRTSKSISVVDTFRNGLQRDNTSHTSLRQIKRILKEGIERS